MAQGTKEKSTGSPKRNTAAHDVHIKCISENDIHHSVTVRTDVVGLSLSLSFRSSAALLRNKSAVTIIVCEMTTLDSLSPRRPYDEVCLSLLLRIRVLAVPVRGAIAHAPSLVSDALGGLSIP